MSDYYEILGVDRNASAEDIKRAFRKKAHEYHPDKANGDEAKFKEVNEAYQVLSDEQKKTQYDQFGQTFDGAGGGPGPGAGFEGFDVNFEDLGGIGDIFSQFFGGQRGGGRQVNRGADVQMDTTISFAESAFGVERQVNVRLLQTCEKCHGNGAEPGTPIEECAECKGQGFTVQNRQTPFGNFAQQAVCRACAGEGKKAKTPCSQCRGEGREVREVSLDVRIPAGIASGQTIRLSGKGEAAPKGGVNGDLYLTVHVTADEKMTRDGSLVRSEVEIDMTSAALGTTSQVKTLDGEKEIEIPAGTQPGEEIIISGAGFPEGLDSGVRDNHLVTVKVVVPKKLSREQRQLLEQFSSAKKPGFFG